MHKKGLGLYYAGLMAIAVIWGTNFGISRLAMDTFHPILFTFIRFGGAVPFFFLLLKWKEGSIGIPLRAAGKLALIGLFGITGLELLVMYSIKYTSLANASLLNVAPWPIFAALFAPMFTNERLTRQVAVGGAAALVGVVTVILGGGEGLDLSLENMLGNAMALAVSLIGALYNLYTMSLMTRFSALRVSTWTIAFGSIFLLPLTWGTWDDVLWGELGGVQWFSILFNVFLCTVVAFVVWNACMMQAGATRSNFFRYLVPAAAVVAGYLMFDEGITVMQLAGAAFMAAGLVWIQLERPVGKGNGGRDAA